MNASTAKAQLCRSMFTSDGGSLEGVQCIGFYFSSLISLLNYLDTNTDSSIMMYTVLTDPTLSTLQYSG